MPGPGVAAGAGNSEAAMGGPPRHRRAPKPRRKHRAT